MGTLSDPDDILFDLRALAMFLQKGGRMPPRVNVVQQAYLSVSSNCATNVRPSPERPVYSALYPPV